MDVPFPPIFMVYKYVVGRFTLTFQFHCAIYFYKDKKLNVILLRDFDLDKLHPWQLNNFAQQFDSLYLTVWQFNSFISFAWQFLEGDFHNMSLTVFAQQYDSCWSTVQQYNSFILFCVWKWSFGSMKYESWLQPMYTQLYLMHCITVTIRTRLYVLLYKDIGTLRSIGRRCIALSVRQLNVAIGANMPSRFTENLCAAIYCVKVQVQEVEGNIMIIDAS